MKVPFRIDEGLNIDDKVKYLHGEGSPEGVISASIGSIYSDTISGTIYRKETGTGNTGWIDDISSLESGLEQEIKDRIAGDLWEEESGFLYPVNSSNATLAKNFVIDQTPPAMTSNTTPEPYETGWYGTYRIYPPNEINYRTFNKVYNKTNPESFDVVMDANNIIHHYIKLDKKTVVNSFYASWQMYNYNGTATAEFIASDDGANWTSLYSFPDTGYADGIFNISNSTKYLYYGFKILANSDSIGMVFRNLDLFPEKIYIKEKLEELDSESVKLSPIDPESIQTINSKLLFSNDTEVNGNVVIHGNILAQGTTTFVDSTNMAVSDNEIVLNKGEPGSGVTRFNAGLRIDRGLLDDAQLQFDEASDKWRVGYTRFPESGFESGYDYRYLAYEDQLTDFALDSEVVHKDLTETITGDKTFSDITLSDMNRTFAEYGDDTKIATGIPWGDRGKFKINISYESDNFVSASLAFVGANTSFSYYINAKRFIVTPSNISAYTANAPESEGVWFFYINQNTADADSPNMALTKTPWNINDPDVLLWNFYENASNNTITWIGEERHTAGRDIYQHARNHAQGAIYKNGLLANHYNGLSSTLIDTNTDNNFGRALVQIGSGSFYDEDILNTITHLDAAVNATIENPSTNWNLTTSQFLGFTATATTGTNSTTIVFSTPRTLATAQAIMVFTSAGAARGTTTITTGGTGTTFTVATLTGLTDTDIIYVGARIPIYYVSAVNNGVYTWRKLPSSSFLGVSGTTSLAYTPSNISTDVAQFNNATSGGFSPITANRFYPVYLMATNSTFEPIIAVLGQGQSTSGTLSTALGEAPFQFSNVAGLSNLGLQEVVPFYRLTYMYNSGGAYTNTRIKLRDATFINVRVSTASGSVLGSSVTSLQAGQVVTDTTNFSGALSVADTTAQAALDTLDDAVANKENISNKSTVTTLGTSDTLYPTQNAVKTYVDDSGKLSLIPIMTSNTSPGGIASLTASGWTTAGSSSIDSWWAFDGNDSTGIFGATIAGSAFQGTIASIYEFGGGISSVVNKISIRFKVDVDSVEGNNWMTVFEGWNGSSWSAISVGFDGGGGGGVGDIDITKDSIYSFSNTTAYTKYKLTLVINRFGVGTNTASATIYRFQLFSDSFKGYTDATLESRFNKSTTTTLGTSDTLYPTQNAVKTYVDNSNINWTPSQETWTYASADSPTYTFTIPNDVTTKYSEGMKIRLQQSQSLTAYWPMSADVVDTINALNGTASGITYTAGKFGNAVLFDNNGDSITVADNILLKPTTEWTFGAWFKTSTATGLKPIFSSYSENTAIAGIFVGVNAAVIQVTTGNNTGTTVGVNYTQLFGTTTVTDGNWHQIIVTFKNNWVQIYLDGRIETRGWMITPVYAAINYVRLGGYSTTTTGLAGRWGGTGTPGQLQDFYLINGYALDENYIYKKYVAQTAQSSSALNLTKHFLITKEPTYSNPNTTITCFGGTDFSLTNNTITNPFYSTHQQPWGFIRNPDKWSVIFENKVDFTLAGAANNVIQTPGTFSMVVPIGKWDLYYEACLGIVSSSTLVETQMCIHSNNTVWPLETDYVNHLSISAAAGATVPGVISYVTMNKSNILSLPSAKQTWYFITRKINSTGTVSTIIYGARSKTIIKATSVYL
jgi:hypothetical protein